MIEPIRRGVKCVLRAGHFTLLIVFAIVILPIAGIPEFIRAGRDVVWEIWRSTQ